MTGELEEQERRWPWPPGAATGIGSLPGTDIAEAQRIVLGELPEFPHLPELPARGPGAEIIGRGAGFLVELPVELYAGRWRVASRPGRDLRRTRDLLERDLDQLTEQAAGYTGPVKVQSAGPWTLSSHLERPVGGRMLRDAGAVRDLTDSLAEGLAAHVADVAARLPGASVLLQLDEPSLPAVLAGRVPTESGFGMLRVVEASTATDALRAVINAAGVPVIMHCCAPAAPIGVFQSAGAKGLALDLSFDLDAAGLDALGEALDAGLGLFAGALPTVEPAGGRLQAASAERTAAGERFRAASPEESAASDGAGAPPGAGGPSSADIADRVRKLWRRIGFPLADLPGQVVVTPACGLASATPEYARAALSACREAGRRLLEEG
jgi:methionine synthase II (cobalamin-independent)